MFEAMMHLMGNLLFNALSHDIQKMMSLQYTHETDKEHPAAELVEIIVGIAACD